MKKGLKNIANNLLKRGCEVTVYPYNTKASEIIADKPDGIMLSNGPGDPKENTQVIEEVKNLYNSDIPIFAICLGHQLMALANGADTYKLKYGHRGGNHPVKDLESGRTYISSQNHGYAVDVETKGIDVVLSHSIQNDKLSLTNDFAFNLTQTKKVGEIHTPRAIKAAGLEEKFFSERSRVLLEEVIPRFKATLSHNLTIGKWNGYLRNTYYGKATGPDIIRTADQVGDFVFDERGHQVIRGKIITDLSIAYNFTPKTSFTLGVNNLFDLYPEKNVKVNNNNDQFVY